ncbi:MAG TPA: BlaI/MecI/CopY family transcriptional regulator [Gemmatimonadaceae bacterium]|nr:BlaI/MecI/CopY family transcriptional regulator [Gemmatimonadaceae bacterium]
MTDIYFPPRELEVMSVLWRLGSATVAEVRDALDEPLAYTTVLSALQTLEEKGYVRHEPEGRAYRYFPLVEADHAGGSALARIRDAIFHGSAERMFAQMVSDHELGREELERLRRLIADRLKDAEDDAPRAARPRSSRRKT